MFLIMIMMTYGMFLIQIIKVFWKINSVNWGPTVFMMQFISWNCTIICKIPLKIKKKEKIALIKEVYI